MAVKLFALFQS